jgi:hypothetical protein
MPPLQHEGVRAEVEAVPARCIRLLRKYLFLAFSIPVKNLSTIVPFFIKTYENSLACHFDPFVLTQGKLREKSYKS